jgi:hypothetical protein
LSSKVAFRISIFNLIIILFLILDNLIPNYKSEVSYLNSIYGFSEKSSYVRVSNKRPVIDFKIILELTDDKKYRLGFNPENEKFEKGIKIKVYKSFISNNVNFIEIYDDSWEKYYCGLLRNYAILFPFILSIILSIFSFQFLENKIIRIGLILSMMYLTILFFIYNFYF